RWAARAEVIAGARHSDSRDTRPEASSPPLDRGLRPEGENTPRPVRMHVLRWREVRVAGVDGTRGGWVAIVLEESRFAADLVLPSVATDFAELADVDEIGIDVPIGFGPRAADKSARAFLKGAASTVFTTPSRDVLVRPFSRGMGVPAQAHALGPR